MGSSDKWTISKPNTPGYYYTRRDKRKKNGKIRIIYAPCPALKAIQKEFSEWLYEQKKDVLNNGIITGFMPNKSIVDNARPHLGKEWVANLDIKNFFPTITESKVRELLTDIASKRSWWKRLLKPKEFGFKNYTINEMANLLTLNGQLIQGSPASPIIANIIGMEIDKIICGYYVPNSCMSFTYTRYADDLTISTYNTFSREIWEVIIKEMIRGIETNTIFKVNPNKINIKHRSQKQEVTGIVVSSGKLGINKQLRNKLRATIHTYKKLNKTLDDKLLGVLNFIHSINKDQYNKLMGVSNECNTSETN